MKFNAYIQAIYLTASAGAQMLSVNIAKAKAGIGLEGDRYALGEGRGGIRAKVLNSGALAVGDKLFIGDEE